MCERSGRKYTERSRTSDFFSERTSDFRRSSGLPVLRSCEIFQSSGVFRSSGLPVFRSCDLARSSSLPVFRSSGLPVFRWLWVFRCLLYSGCVFRSPSGHLLIVVIGYFVILFLVLVGWLVFAPDFLLVVVVFICNESDVNY
jgi:hypothetical protein